MTELAREKFKTLTEQMFYVLLCLKTERCGIELLKLIPEFTNGRVTVGAGTLYTLLEQFQQADMICETRVEGRRHSYIITQKGEQMLQKEYDRLNAQVLDYKKIKGELQ